MQHKSILFLPLLHLGVALWHAYDKSKQHNVSCMNTIETDQITHNDIHKYNLWPMLMTHHELKLGEAMTGFNTGFEEVWKNQHPQDCKNAKFLIASHYDSGFGSEFHVLGATMAAALNMNRVYIWPKHKTKFGSPYEFIVNNTFCRNQKLGHLECYFEPWTNCTWEDALGNTTYEQLWRDRVIARMPVLAQTNVWNQTERTLIATEGTGSQHLVPIVFRDLLNCSPITPSKYRYWWRAVAAAYMLRPNPATLKAMAQYRTLDFDPQKEQCVSVHIRHGDKHVEMNMIEDVTEFFDAAKLLWGNLQASDARARIQQRGVMFVGTEDPEALVVAKQWGLKHNWKVLYTDIFDRSAVSTRLNYTVQQAMIRDKREVHHEHEYLSMLLNIDYHLKCSAFVCTERSNFCRVIDELRATVANKAHLQYADMSCTPTGSQKPPCIDSPQTSIDW